MIAGVGLVSEPADHGEASDRRGQRKHRLAVDELVLEQDAARHGDFAREGAVFGSGDDARRRFDVAFGVVRRQVARMWRADREHSLTRHPSVNHALRLNPGTVL